VRGFVNILRPVSAHCVAAWSRIGDFSERNHVEVRRKRLQLAFRIMSSASALRAIAVSSLVDAEINVFGISNAAQSRCWVKGINFPSLRATQETEVRVPDAPRRLR
jgi:hypothetical protein